MTAANIGVNPKDLKPMEERSGQFCKISASATLPTLNQVGWDITLTTRTDNRTDDVLNEVNYFSTGLRLCPPPGYHFEFVASPALYKAGYMVASGFCIGTDENFDEELIIPLFKFRQSDDLELPFRGIIMILRKTLTCHLSKESSVVDEMPRKKVSLYDPPTSNASGSTSTNVSASTRSRRKESSTSNMW